MQGHVSHRGRWAAGIAAGSAAALVVGALALVPAAGSTAAVGWSQSPSPFSAPADPAPTSTSVARSSSSLARSLAAQSRIFEEISDVSLAAAPAPSAVKKTATKKTATKKAAAKKPALAMKPGSGPLWERLPVLEPGAEGKAVAFLQFKLQTKKTGFYGPLTLAAVTKYQESRGLPAKGYVGALTWRAILTGAKPVADETSSSGSTRSTTSSRSVVRAPVTAGKVCPAPGAAFGSGWGAQRAGHLHQGVDLVAGRGTPILAVESGYIVRAGVQSNGAIRIVQQGASGPKYFYGHMDRITVGAGSRVSRGQVIGYMGDTGSPGSVHLHFEYWPSGGESAAVDPYPLLKSLCW